MPLFFTPAQIQTFRQSQWVMVPGELTTCLPKFPGGFSTCAAVMDYQPRTLHRMLTGALPIPPRLCWTLYLLQEAHKVDGATIDGWLKMWGMGQEEWWPVEGAWMQQVRHQWGLSRRELVVLLGYSRHRIAQMEQGYHPLAQRLVRQIQLLGIIHQQEQAWYRVLRIRGVESGPPIRHSGSSSSYASETDRDGYTLEAESQWRLPRGSA